ncbi:hypothetical protein [Pseudanabaena mucicola]|uniref:Uncharacterized protein n=1 Tax=Pseudanabaena mucicola FACHB-723 TaxID=2692860 RepID=A0ABR8A3Q4_9CYAN|nr:hypothetical protein [Pseudanabaena mucicola]MBD2190002.1 hypothetical protein [Pseudanabaena mucicola FACHB-723]
MALKPQKQAVEPTQPEYQTTPAPLSTIVDIELENAIANELLDSIDWSKVRAAIIRKAPAKLFAWLTSGNDTPVNISPFPELAVLHSSDDEGKAA